MHLKIECIFDIIVVSMTLFAEMLGCFFPGNPVSSNLLRNKAFSLLWSSKCRYEMLKSLGIRFHPSRLSQPPPGTKFQSVLKASKKGQSVL